jgi:putative ABC transport system permease protein
MVGVLYRMLWRDAWHLRGQVLASALVMACGVATLLAMRSTYQSLVAAQDGYYSQYRLADVFAQLKRAPLSLAERAQHIAGVASVQARVVRTVSVDIPGLDDPATARIIGIPIQSQTTLNALHMVSGRQLAATGGSEVIASSAFASANGLVVGDRIAAVLNGRWRELRIVGTAMSPEFVYEVAPGGLLPDNRRFGVLWMDQDALAYAFNMRGAFNDINLALSPGASQSAVIDRLDQLLSPYGGLGAYGREEQLSHRFVADELAEIRVSTSVIPGLFLGIAAFLVYVTLARVVTLQRAEIGLLKAFGYSDRRVGLHYLLFALLVASLGLSLGIPAGALLGRFFVDIYREYFHFPALHAALPSGVVTLTATAAVVAAGLGAVTAVRRSLRLAPADAMKPPAPASYRPGWMERFGRNWRLRPPGRMIMRSLARRPTRALLAVLAIASAVALMVVGRFSVDAVDRMVEIQFDNVMRGDLTVIYGEPRPAVAALSAARLSGVLRAESFRSVPVWLRNGSHARRIELQGIAASAQLRRVLDQRLRPVALPADGLALTRKLAELLRVGLGDRIDLEVIQGARLTAAPRVTAIIDEYIGLGAYMDSTALSRLLREDAVSSGVYLRTDPLQRAALNTELKRLPVVAGVTSRAAIRASVEDAMDRSFLLVSALLMFFSCTIVVGIVYNTVRIALSERGHELASLRVLGFTEREVGMILLGEQALLTALAIPLGLLGGYGLCAAMVPAFDREAFRLPLVVSNATLVLSASVTVVASLLSGLLVARRLRQLDLIEVLKTRE